MGLYSVKPLTQRKRLHLLRDLENKIRRHANTLIFEAVSICTTLPSKLASRGSGATVMFDVRSRNVKEDAASLEHKITASYVVVVSRAP